MPAYWVQSRSDISLILHIVWFTRIINVLDHALTALATLPRVRQRRFVAGYLEPAKRFERVH